jgi:hypothetical protein
MRPVTAPEGTLALMELAEMIEKAAGVPPNVTCVAPLKFEPEMVTIVPTGPLSGENELTVGGSVTTKSPAVW